MLGSKWLWNFMVLQVKFTFMGSDTKHVEFHSIFNDEDDLRLGLIPVCVAFSLISFWISHARVKTSMEF